MYTNVLIKLFGVFRKVNERYYVPHFINMMVHATSGLEQDGEGVGRAMSSSAVARVQGGGGLG